MPNANSVIQFKYGLQAGFDKITTKDLNTVYFCTDSQRLFVGDVEYSRPVGHGATLPTAFLPPNSLFVQETSTGKDLYFSQDGESWTKISHLPASVANTGTFGGATKVPQITVDAGGNITAVKEVPISFPAAPTITVDDKQSGNVVTDVTASGHTVTLSRATMATPTDVTNAVKPVADDVATLKSAPSAGITADQITSWNNEVGAKAAAEAAQETADAAVVANAAITGATKCKITYDAKGLVTAGADLAVADIPTLPSTKISGLGTAAAKDAATAAITANSTDDDLVSASQVATFVKGQVADLAGAMHFVGISTTDPKGATGATVAGHTTWKKGDVILYGTGEDGQVSKEYVLVNTPNTADNWRELGDETSFAVKGSIVNSDIAANANIDQSKIAGLTDTLNGKVDKTTTVTGSNGLTGGGALSSNQVISHAGKAAGLTDVTANGRKYVTGLTFDAYGHVTAVTTGSETVVDTNTTYTFADGTDGSFKVTPSGGSAQTVKIGKPSTAGTADKVAHSLTINGTVFDGSADKSVSIPTSYNLDSLTDVTITTPANTNLLQYNGSAWVNAPAADISVGSAATLSTARSFSITGGATADVVTFNGSAPVELNVTRLAANKLEGEITDDVTATTQAVSDDSAKVATTAFVHDVVAGAALKWGTF